MSGIAILIAGGITVAIAGALGHRAGFAAGWKKAGGEICVYPFGSVLVRPALEAERERCARVAEATCCGADAGDGRCCAWAIAQGEIAAAIRERTSP